MYKPLDIGCDGKEHIGVGGVVEGIRHEAHGAVAPCPFISDEKTAK